ncbi:hypothetical protein BZA70DRAFT_270537 [Myxozyma melibiosi]|uniref:Uncharacterized protein n=1 Tax=Myxozyma melibiosi TaxID=54550 RepID=A0ABR1FBA5_9ASCO
MVSSLSFVVDLSFKAVLVVIIILLAGLARGLQRTCQLVRVSTAAVRTFITTGWSSLYSLWQLLISSYFFAVKYQQFNMGDRQLSELLVLLQANWRVFGQFFVIMVSLFSSIPYFYDDDQQREQICRSCSASMNR